MSAQGILGKYNQNKQASWALAGVMSRCLLPKKKLKSDAAPFLLQRHLAVVKCPPLILHYVTHDAPVCFASYFLCFGVAQCPETASTEQEMASATLIM